MCGIAIVASSDTVPVEAIDALFTLIAPRGPDACGVAYYDPRAYRGEGEWVYDKCTGPISNLRNRRRLVGLAEDLRPQAALLHTRYATHGSPQVFENNHPIVSERSLLIHNGVIATPQQYPASGETDSEQLIRHLEASGLPSLQGLAQIQGSYALGLVSLARPREVLAVKGPQSPLYSASTPYLFVACSCPFSVGGIRAKELPPYTGTRVDFTTPRLTIVPLAVPRPVPWRARTKHVRFSARPQFHFSEWALPQDEGGEEDRDFLLQDLGKDRE